MDCEANVSVVDYFIVYCDIEIFSLLKFIPQIHWWNSFAVWSATTCNCLNILGVLFIHRCIVDTSSLVKQINGLSFPKFCVIFQFYNTACNCKFYSKKPWVNICKCYCKLMFNISTIYCTDYCIFSWDNVLSFYFSFDWINDDENYDDNLWSLIV